MDQRLESPGEDRRAHSLLLVETVKDTVWYKQSALVKEELQSPSKADKPATFVSNASYHAGQDKEEMTGLSQLPRTITEAPMQSVHSQTAPLPSQLPGIITEVSGQSIQSQSNSSITNMFRESF